MSSKGGYGITGRLQQESSRRRRGNIRGKIRVSGPTRLRSAHALVHRCGSRFAGCLGLILESTPLVHLLGVRQELVHGHRDLCQCSGPQSWPIYLQVLTKHVRITRWLRMRGLRPPCHFLVHQAHWFNDDGARQDFNPAGPRQWDIAMGMAAARADAGGLASAASALRSVLRIPRTMSEWRITVRISCVVQLAILPRPRFIRSSV